MNEFDRKSDKEKFEEEFGSVENFSRKHVESLFDDDPPHPPLIPPSKTGAGSGIKAHEDMDEDEIAKQALINGIFGEGAGSDLPRRPPYQRMGKASDPEAEYQAYLDLATEESRKEQQKKQADKEAAMRHRDEKLDELPKSRRNLAASNLQEPPPESQKRDASEKPNRGGSYRLNLRKVAAVALLFVLTIFAILVWQLMRVNNQLSEANEQIYALSQYDDELNMLRFENMSLRNDVERLEEELAGSQNQPSENGGGYGDVVGQPPGEGTTQPQTQHPTPNVANTTVDAAGNWIYTIQPNDTLFRVSNLFFGTTARWQDIRDYNNLPSDEIITGNTLRIPQN